MESLFSACSLSDRLSLDQSLLYLLTGVVGVTIYIAVGLVEKGSGTIPHPLALVLRFCLETRSGNILIFFIFFIFLSTAAEVFGVCFGLYLTVGITIKVNKLLCGMYSDLFMSTKHSPPPNYHAALLFPLTVSASPPSGGEPLRRLCL